MLARFATDNALLLRFLLALSGVAGLFLNVTPPDPGSPAAVPFGNIRVTLLTLLAGTVTAVLIRFTGATFRNEWRVWKEHGMWFFGSTSFLVAVASFWISFNLLQYLMTADPAASDTFFGIFLKPAMLVWPAVVLMLLETREQRLRPVAEAAIGAPVFAFMVAMVIFVLTPPFGYQLGWRGFVISFGVGLAAGLGIFAIANRVRRHAGTASVGAHRSALPIDGSPVSPGARARYDTRMTYEALETLLRKAVTAATELRESAGAKRQLALYGKKEVKGSGGKLAQTYVAGIVEQKGYVGFYFFPIYTHPSAFADIPEDLRALLKGKSCFHVRDFDAARQKQVAALLKKGIALYRTEGLI